MKKTMRNFQDASMSQENWEEIVDFTKIETNGIEIEKLLEYLFGVT